MKKTQKRHIKKRIDNTRKKGGMMRMLGLQRQPRKRFTPITKDDLKEAIFSYYHRRHFFLENARYQGIGRIDTWDVSNITDMSRLFHDLKDFNEDINDWDVRNVTNMSEMFRGCDRFNKPLNNWDVSNVTNMSQMFLFANSFNQPLNSWIVSNVRNMSGMFHGAYKFNQPLNSWNVSNVTNMATMFCRAERFNQPLNSWNVSNVTNMSAMFNRAVKFNQPLNSWIVSNVRNMAEMFKEANVFNQPLDLWNVGRVVNMDAMFSFTKKFNQPLNSWNVSNVTHMGQMFKGAKVFNQPLDRWNVRNVEVMIEMFSNTEAFNQPLHAWETVRLLYNYDMFHNARAYQYTPVRAGMQRIGLEVHSTFNALNFDLLFDTIIVGINVIDSVTPDVFYNWLTEKLSDASVFKQPSEAQSSEAQPSTEQPSEEEETETQHLKNNLLAIRHKLVTMPVPAKLGKHTTWKFIGAIMSFVDSQPREFIKNYVSSYIKDNIGAYGGNYDNNDTRPNNTTSSCGKGMFERIILNLRTGGLGLDSPSYRKIAKIVSGETVVDDDCDNHTKPITNDLISSSVSMCLNNPTSNIKKQLLDVTDKQKGYADIRTNMIAMCVLKNFVDNGHIKPPEGHADSVEYYDQELVGRIRAYLTQDGVSEMYLDNSYLEGGRGRRQSGKKTRKNRIKKLATQPE